MLSVTEALKIADGYHRNGDTNDAQVQYQRILRVEPGHPEALHALGIIAFQLKKYITAGNLIGKAIENKPKVPQFHYNLGLVFISLKRQEKAIQAFQEAIKIKPDYADAHYNLGLALKKQQQFEEAILNFKQVIKLTPDDADAYYNLGNAYEALDRYESAVENYQLAIRKNGAFAGAFNNLALVLKAMGRIDEAISHFREAVRLQSEFADAHWNLSLALLINGQFEEGWKEHEWRFRRGKRSTIYPHRFGIPLWDGSSFTGKRLFVHSEQGFGDTLQFIRYLPMVKSLGGTVIFEAFGPLLGIIRGFPGIDKLVELSPDRHHVESCDYYVPIMSLPMLFATDIPTIPSNIPYIFADPEKVGQWKNRINKKGYRIGIVWAGKPEHENDGNRSCELAQFLPLARIPGVELYGLQKGGAARQAETLIINFDRELTDFSETAAAIENLDLVISIDTASVHLAGAMGKPVWTLLPHAPDWRWLLEREDSPWYPTMRLFRQPARGDWGAVFGKVKDELQKLVASTTPYHPSCGDALYARNARKSVITMSTLGKNGRFANQIFQYAFLKTYAKRHNLIVETPEWIGTYLFGCDDQPISKRLSLVRQETYKLTEDHIPNAKEPFKNVDFSGYFQYHTSYYAPYKDYFRSLFQPVSELEIKLKHILSVLCSRGKTIVGLHLRRGDYGYGHFFVAPSEWYKKWLEDLWETLDQPVLFIASDEPEEVLGDFAEYLPVALKDLGLSAGETAFYLDFFLLSQCDIVAISNSSFSFAACMLNERAKLFLRPHLPTKKLIPFDPWNGETIFRDAKVEDYSMKDKVEAITHSIAAPSLSSRDQLEKLIPEFLELYNSRPVRNNEGGLQSVGSFSLWFFLRRIKPGLVIESGVWKGWSTWLIEKTLPEANIICLDPLSEVRQYTSERAVYPSIDFGDMSFKDVDISNALVFFDDHQNAYERVKQSMIKGFRHLIFDDNYPIENESHVTLQQCLNEDDDKRSLLEKIIKNYEIFRPLYHYDQPITNENVFIDLSAWNISESLEFEILKQDMKTYRWMTYVELFDYTSIKKVQKEGCIPANTENSQFELESPEVYEKETQEMPFPSINALLCFLSRRETYRSTIISTNEVFCGPDCETNSHRGKYRTINTPAGAYDIEEIVARLPQSQKPEFVIVKADATGRNFPFNIKNLKCPKLLILGNTQHLRKPISSLLQYARQENFDFIASDHKRHHLHYFKEAGFDNVFWIPGFNNYPHAQPFHKSKKHKISFVGQAGRWHPYRRDVLQYLKSKGVEIDIQQVPQAKAAEIYAKSSINLNVSLNGDLNLRIFEVLSSGSFLITDKLGPESGLELLFKDGEHLICFENEKDLFDKINYFQRHPDEAAEIARNGYEAYKNDHTPEKKIRALMDYILKGVENPL